MHTTIGCLNMSENLDVCLRLLQLSYDNINISPVLSTGDIITSAKEVMFSPGFVCGFVSLCIYL